MRGCLSLPFRLLSLAIFAALCWLAWTYRDDIRRKIHQLTADKTAPAAPAPAARPPASPTAALRRLDAVLRGQADSAVFTGAEVAAVAQRLADSTVSGSVDSISATLGQDEVSVRGRVDTRKLPISPGVLSGVIRDHETVETGGRLLFRRPGLIEWEVQKVRVRGLPVPIALVDRLLARFGSAPDTHVIGIPIPQTISGLRVTHDALVVYGRTGRRG